MDHDIDRILEHGGRAGRDDNPPGGIGRPDHFAEVSSGLRGIFVNRTNDFNRSLLPDKAQDRSANRPDSELSDANFLSQETFLGIGGTS